MKRYKFKINKAVYEVDILDVTGNLASIEVNGKKYEVEVEREAKPVVTKPVKAAAPDSESDLEVAITLGDGPIEEIKAPLPGTVIKVLVKPGDKVKADQSVCTLETMKMENAIKAEKDGIITSVKITAGQSVQQDELLIEMSGR